MECVVDSFETDPEGLSIAAEINKHLPRQVLFLCMTLASANVSCWCKLQTCTAFSDAPLCDVLITKDRDSHGHAGPGAKRAEDEPEV